jgi:DNA gyrase/topoisomerase IV subunit A
MVLRALELVSALEKKTPRNLTFLPGWSTTVPCYNPVDIVDNLRRLMAGEEMVSMLPWWRGFKGTIKKVGDHKYDVTGVVRKINDTTVEITELPIHKWTQTYKAELEAMIGEKGEGVLKVNRHLGVSCTFTKAWVYRITRNTTIT